MAEKLPDQPEMTDVVLAVIVRERRVLIARRREQDPFGGFWELPGGKRQPGEAILDCLAREVMEELGVRIRPGQAFPPIVHAYPDKTVRLLAFVCRLENAEEPRPPRPLAADCLLWATAAELPTYRFPEANAILIERIIAHLSRAES